MRTGPTGVAVLLGAVAVAGGDDDGVVLGEGIAEGGGAVVEVLCGAPRLVARLVAHPGRQMVSARSTPAPLTPFARLVMALVSWLSQEVSRPVVLIQINVWIARNLCVLALLILPSDGLTGHRICPERRSRKGRHQRPPLPGLARWSPRQASQRASRLSARRHAVRPTATSRPASPGRATTRATTSLSRSHTSPPPNVVDAASPTPPRQMSRAIRQAGRLPRRGPARHRRTNVNGRRP